jgi:hypothetical protein
MAEVADFLAILEVRGATSPFRGLRSTSLRHDDDGVDIGSRSRLGTGYCIDDRTRFFDQPPEHVVQQYGRR